MWLFHWREKKKAKILNDLNSYISDSKNKAEKSKAVEPDLELNEESKEENAAEVESSSQKDDVRYKFDNTHHYRKRLSDDNTSNADIRKNLSDNYDVYLENDYESSNKKYDFKDLFSKAQLTVSKYIIFFIDKHNLKDADVYKRANLSRQYFNSVINDRIKIGKEKALALCIGLKLDIDEANVLLRAAGYAFSPIEVNDLIYKYSIEHRIYDIDFIEEIILDYSKKEK